MLPTGEHASPALINVHSLTLSQRFLPLVAGIFYGGGCQRPFLVPVPVRDGVARWPTLDDLDVNYWVKQCHADDCRATWRHLRRTFSRVPGSHVTLDGHYMLYVETPRPSIRRSRLLSRMAIMSGCQEAFQGSALVVKQAQDAPHHITNMTKRDQLLVNFLIVLD